MENEKLALAEALASIVFVFAALGLCVYAAYMHAKGKWPFTVSITVLVLDLAALMTLMLATV